MRKGNFDENAPLLRKIIYLLVFFIVFCHFFAISQSKSNPWILKKNENGITVYTRDIENSSFKELKASLQVKTSLSSIVALLNDWESYTKWVYRCGKSTTLKKISDTECIHYQNVTAPWPVDNRDIVVKVKISQDEITKIIKQSGTSQPNFIPLMPNHIRIIEFNAVWTITPLANGIVNIEYQLSVNPGGTVPAWLVNLAVVDGPFETTSNLKSWVMKEKYQKAVIPFILEP